MKYYDGYRSECKACVKIYLAAYYQATKVVQLEKARIAYALNPEPKKASSKRYAKANPEKVRKAKREYKANKKKTDVNFKITENIRCRVWHAIKGKIKVSSAIRELGCTPDFLRTHLASLFQPGMTWDNYGKFAGKWNVDHIIPLHAFDLTDLEQFKKACHYTNLQPLWHEHNNEKHNHLDYNVSTSVRRPAALAG
jgi:hypothetical protein